MDISDTIQVADSAGGQAVREPRDVGGGKLIAVITDPDGNRLGLGQDSR